MKGKINYDHYYYGHGKLIITGEYFVLDGALALALPTTVGQSLEVKYRSSFEPYLYWRSLARDGSIWFEAKFEFWHFDLIDTKPTEQVLQLQKILRHVREQNTHFLRDEVDVLVETKLEFPLHWGLGASSTLIHNISQWAFVSPFELLFKTIGGSGYDIACAQSPGPILYKKSTLGPKWTVIPYDPPFKDHLYFVYSGKKQSSQEAMSHYQQNRAEVLPTINRITSITKEILEAQNLHQFEKLLIEHEGLISKELHLNKVQETLFNDYSWGVVKSLGAWGGDFLLVTGDIQSRNDIQEYFRTKGLEVFIPYSELILNNQTNDSPFSMKSLDQAQIGLFFDERLEKNF